MANDDDDSAQHSISSAARLLGRDRASIRAALTGIAGDAPAVKRQQRWRLGTVKRALGEHDARVDAARLSNNNASGGGDDGDGDQSEFRRERAGYMRARRLAAERENEIAAARLIPVNQIEPALVDFHTAIRSRVLRLASIAPALTGKPVTEVFKILQDRIDEALSDLSDDSDGNPIYRKLFDGIRKRAG
jgi:hypothetical protein